MAPVLSLYCLLFLESHKFIGQVIATTVLLLYLDLVFVLSVF